MDMWDKAIELYIAMQKAYGELPEGVYESAKTQSAEAEYYALLSESGLMDSQIVDECWGMEFQHTVSTPCQNQDKERRTSMEAYLANTMCAGCVRIGFVYLLTDSKYYCLYCRNDKRQGVSHLTYPEKIGAACG